MGWPWVPKKFVDFAFAFLYIGFLWNLTNRTVELPAEKKAKYLERLKPWIDGKTMPLSDAERLIGTLNHVCLVVPEGRSYLTQLYAFRSSFKNRDKVHFCQHKVADDLRADLKWWKERLSQDFLGLHIQPPLPLSPLTIYVDASTSWGIGLIIDGRWLAWELLPGWQGNKNERHIGWGEMVAVELAIRTLIAAGYCNIRIIIRSDNEGVVGALKKGNSRGHEQNLILRKIVELMLEHNIFIECTWILTHENPADGPSRGEFPPRKLMYARPPRIPNHLKAYVDKSVTPNDPRLLAQEAKRGLPRT